MTATVRRAIRLSALAMSCLLFSKISLAKDHLTITSDPPGAKVEVDGDGLTWADGDKKGGMAMQCDKNEYRGILAALEGVSGKKAVNSDTMTVKN